MKPRAIAWKRRPRLCAFACIGAVLALTNGHLQASSKMTAAGVLRQYHLSEDEASLLGCLETGLPQDFSGEFNRRWEVYRWIATKLGELESTKASPKLIRLIEKPLPLPLRDDLFVHAATNSHEDSWQEWDDERTRAHVELRAACAGALTRIGDENALPVLIDYMNTLKPIIERDGLAEKDRFYYSLFRSYSTICRDITALGSKVGIDALIETLDDDLPLRFPFEIIYFLRICTGQPFGPEYSQPMHMRPPEFQKWHDWWERNRDDFRIDRQYVLNAESPDLPKIVPVSLRDHIDTALRYMSYDGTGEGDKSAAWLEENGGGIQMNEFAAIVNNRDEDANVRCEALKLYVRYARFKALDLLKEYATDASISREKDVDWRLQNKAWGLIKEHFPGTREDMARRCMLSQHPMSYPMSNIVVVVLALSADNYPLLVENYARLDDLARLNILHRLLGHSDPVGRPVFFEAVRDSDIRIAVAGARGIRKFSLEAEMPEDSRRALANWQMDPLFHFHLLDLIERSLPDEEKIAAVNAALQFARGTDAKSGKAYYWAWNILPSDQRDTAMAGLMRCIEEYKKSRPR